MGKSGEKWEKVVKSGEKWEKVGKSWESGEKWGKVANSGENTQLLFVWIFLQNGLWRPFWMTENHFRSHFSPFQINTQLFFFSKWPPAAILDPDFCQNR